MFNATAEPDAVNVHPDAVDVQPNAANVRLFDVAPDVVKELVPSIDHASDSAVDVARSALEGGKRVVGQAIDNLGIPLASAAVAHGVGKLAESSAAGYGHVVRANADKTLANHRDDREEAEQEAKQDARLGNEVKAEASMAGMAGSLASLSTGDSTRIESVDGDFHTDTGSTDSLSGHGPQGLTAIQQLVREAEKRFEVIKRIDPSAFIQPCAIVDGDNFNDNEALEGQLRAVAEAHGILRAGEAVIVDHNQARLNERLIEQQQAHTLGVFSQVSDARLAAALRARPTPPAAAQEFVRVYTVCLVATKTTLKLTMRYELVLGSLEGVLRLPGLSIVGTGFGGILHSSGIGFSEEGVRLGKAHPGMTLYLDQEGGLVVSPIPPQEHSAAIQVEFNELLFGVNRRVSENATLVTLPSGAPRQTDERQLELELGAARANKLQELKSDLKGKSRARD